MNEKERIIKALEHDNPDIIPWSIGLTIKMREKLINYTEDPNITDSFDNHSISAIISETYELKDRPGYFKDYFNVIWDRTKDKDIGTVVEYLIKEPNLSAIENIIPNVPYKRINEIKELFLKHDGDEFRILGIGFSLFERAWTLRGMSNLLMDMMVNAKFVDVLLDLICDWNLKCIDYSLQCDYDGFYFGDDWGMQKELIMGPKLWRRFIKPRLAKMYARAKEHGKYIIQHSCGDISDIYPDLVEIGLDAHETFQPEIYDIYEIKKLYAGKLAFWGGISTQQLLPYASQDIVESETRRIMDVMGKGGGFIAAPTHAVPSDVPPENILAMLKVFKEQSK